jgi:hypothetical protein
MIEALASTTAERLVVVDLRRDNQGGDSVNQDENGPGLV